jgi:hypothetical protein
VDGSTILDSDVSIRILQQGRHEQMDQLYAAFNVVNIEVDE